MRSAAGSGVACDLALYQGTIGTAYAGRFTRAINIWQGSGLAGVDADKSISQVAAKQQRQFHIRHQAEAAGEIITIHFPGLRSIHKRHLLDDV